MQATVGAPTKRRRLDTATSEFVDGASNSEDSFRTPDSAVFYTSPDARSVTSASGRLDPFSRGCRRIARNRRDAAIVSCPSLSGRRKEHSGDTSWWSASHQTSTLTASPYFSRAYGSPANTDSHSSWLSTMHSISGLAWTCNIVTCSRSVLQPAT